MAGAERRRAGTYAKARYRSGLREWRARVRRVAAAVFGPILLAGVVVLILEGNQLSWMAGMVTGCAAGAWIAVRDLPPQYIENWQTGAEGERKTEKTLRPLTRHGWCIVHDVQSGAGNYDHIAIGPAGAFLLETKNLRGTVEVRDGVVHMRRPLDREAGVVTFDRIRPQALASAARLKEEIEMRTGHRVWVQAVVVFWSPFETGEVDDGRCVFVHGDGLASWLRSRPTRLPPAAVATISAAIAAPDFEDRHRATAASSRR